MARTTIPIDGKKVWDMSKPSPLLGGAFWTYGVRVKAKNLSELVWLAGCVPLDEKGALVGKNNLKAQTSQCIKNINYVLKEVRGSLKDIVSVRYYVRPDKIEEWIRISDWRLKEFPDLFGCKRNSQGGAPATLIGMERLASTDYLIEIEAFAALTKK